MVISYGKFEFRSSSVILPFWDSKTQKKRAPRVCLDEQGGRISLLSIA